MVTKIRMRKIKLVDEDSVDIVAINVGGAGINHRMGVRISWREGNMRDKWDEIAEQCNVINIKW